MIDSSTGLIPNNPLKDKIIKYNGNVNQAYLQQQNPIKYRVLFQVRKKIDIGIFYFYSK
jgi:hypothetical protein